MARCGYDLLLTDNETLVNLKNFILADEKIINTTTHI